VSECVYYKSKGVADLYNVEWKTTVYVSLVPAPHRCFVPQQTRWELDRMHQLHNDATEKLDQLTETEDLLKQITTN
jgi:hypothetical protein